MIVPIMTQLSLLAICRPFFSAAEQQTLFWKPFVAWRRPIDRNSGPYCVCNGSGATMKSEIRYRGQVLLIRTNRRLI